MGLFWKNRRALETTADMIDSSVHEKEPSAEETLDYPDLRPCDFDKTFEAWLVRLKRWGDFIITYRFPPLKIDKKITQEKFLKDMGNATSSDNFEPFECENKSAVKVVLFREFADERRKKVREEYEFELVRLNLRSGIKDVWTKKR